MTRIEVTPALLRAVASDIERHAQSIDNNVGHTSNLVERAIVSAWLEGYQATSLIERYRRTEHVMATWPNHLRAFAARLRSAADDFEAADNAETTGAGSLDPQALLMALLNASGILDLPLLPFGTGMSINDLLETAEFMLRLFDNIDSPDALVNTLRDMHYDGAADFLALMLQSQALKALPSLIGDLGDLADLDIPGLSVIDLMRMIEERGFSIELLSEWGISEGIKAIITKNPVGLATMALNSANQFIGGWQIDAARLVQNFVTGGNDSLASFQMMEGGINLFADALEDSNLGNVVEGIARVATDFYIDPLVQQYQEVYANPTFGNIAEAVLLTTGNPLAQINWFVDHDDQFKELVVDGAGLIGDTIDVVSGIERLIPASYQMVNGMAIGLETRAIETIVPDGAVRDALLDVASFQLDVSNGITQIFHGAASEIVDFGDSFRGLVGSIF